ncbi:MAG: hypothetical protein E6H00_11255 [Bacillati bacterium ANGP1]|uniref:SHOCT domain-containing protein n=1 Tax=Candidatus Segetimicrobium genomatis TaxID=2569760 RepID=A0A537JZI9_9BACT|nr:MAG: hypothetical protein E6H00_11255 [Terrabacteria group bacterium ANGP1]
MRRWRVHPVVLAGALVAALALPAPAQTVIGPPPQVSGPPPLSPYPFGPHMVGPHMVGARGWGPHPWLVGPFLLLRALLGIGLVVLIWRALLTPSLWRRPDAAVQMLRERYARGEIGDDEYRKRLGTLA